MEGLKLGLDRNSHIIDKLAAEVDVYALLRELVQNSIEAGATKILIHPEWCHARQTKAEGHRIDPLVVSDNGCSMTPEEARALFGAVGSSGKGISSDGNYGTGAKFLTLPFNKKGMDVLFYRDNVAHLLRLGLMSDGNYGILTFTDKWGQDLDTDVLGVLNEDDMLVAEGIPKGLADEYRRPQGTVVILYGNTDGDTYCLGGNHPLAMLRYLQRRYYTLPPGVQVQVYSPPSLDKSKWADCEAQGRDRGNTESQFRNVRGALYHMDKYCAVNPDGSLIKGSTKLTEGTMHWWVFGDADRCEKEPDKATENDRRAKDSKKTGSSAGCAHGFTGILYQDEIYEPSDSHNRAAQCGLFASAARRRATLIFEPHPDLVHANNVRSRLLYTGEGHQFAPWDVWGAEFACNMPKPLADLMTECSNFTDTAKIQDKLNEYLLQMEEYLELPLKPPTGGKRPQKQKTTVSHDTGDGSGPTRKQRGLPIWKEVSQEENPGMAVEYNRRMNTIVAYTNHPRFNKFRELLTKEFPDQPVMDEVIDYAVKYVVAREIGERVVVTNSASIRAEFGKKLEDYENSLSPAALMGVLAGTHSLVARMKQIVGGSSGQKAQRNSSD